jgi:hypothetical protein
LANIVRCGGISGSSIRVRCLYSIRLMFVRVKYFPDGREAVPMETTHEVLREGNRQAFGCCLLGVRTWVVQVGLLCANIGLLIGEVREQRQHGDTRIGE